MASLSLALWSIAGNIRGLLIISSYSNVNYERRFIRARKKPGRY